MRQKRKVRALCCATSLLLIAALNLQSELANAAGIFELQLTKFELLNAPTFKAENTTRQPETGVQIFVCLKEAFASNLLEPCAFGAANFSLDSSNAALIDSSASSNSSSELTSDERATRASTNSNSVKINFKFRWTVSQRLVAQHFAYSDFNFCENSQTFVPR